MFNIYLEDALRRARAEINLTEPRIEHSYAKVTTSNLPQEMVYADDTDILNREQAEKDKALQTICEVFPTRDLKINNDKTEHTLLKRGEKKNEPWREVKKLGSLLGDQQDIARRKHLSSSAMNNLNKVWLRSNHISEKHRLKLYRTLVKPVLLYNCATWGLTKQDSANLDSFHRQQLRRIIGKRYPHKISCKALYKRCEEEPISITITRRRWQLFGHTLRLNKETRAST